MNGILKAIGDTSFEHRKDGNYVVRFPVQHTAIFGQDEEPKARELFASVARKEKGYPSGFEPCAETNGLESSARGQGEVLNALAVRKVCKNDIPPSDYLKLCQIEMPKLLAFVDQAEGDQEEKVRIKQALLRFQARERLTSLRRDKEGQ